MASSYAKAVVFITLACMLSLSMANKDWYHGRFRHGPRRPKPTSNTRKIVVGGSNQWRYGIDYNAWAIKTSPFYLNDTLVFKYDPPTSTPFVHSVYLLPDLWSYWNCDLTRAKMVANHSDSAGEGFEFVVNRWQPYYFACGERGGLHCRNGTMKFFVIPTLPGWF